MNIYEKQVEDSLAKIEKTIKQPERGWKENTLYLVDVSYNDNNPIHRALLYTGLLNGSAEYTFLGAFHNIKCFISDEVKTVEDMRYVSYVSELCKNTHEPTAECRLPREVEREDLELSILPWDCGCGETNGANESRCIKCKSDSYGRG